MFRHEQRTKGTTAAAQKTDEEFKQHQARGLDGNHESLQQDHNDITQQQNQQTGNKIAR